ncbi:cytochrome P450 3A29-like [Biomphalaria glabrata]|uniref:Cytochrome P450 3A29-like n=1 Tax=Biomphalaria glabrata TaxID=6526 RepID=A0A9W2ZIM6_BIOGL|nr:cytochrome P450 3A29-like [Biomphalaria glabrata]
MVDTSYALCCASMPVWFILLVICVILLYIYGNSPYRLWKKLGIQGPETVTFFGNIHEIYGSSGGIASYAKWNSQFGRKYGVYYFRQPALVLTDPDWIKEVYVKDFNNFRDRMTVDSNILLNHEIFTGLFFAEGDVWKRIRSIMSPSFSIAKVKAMNSTIDRSAMRLGDHILRLAEDGKPFEAKRLLGAYAIDVVTGAGFSIDVDSVSNVNEPFTKHGRSLFTYTWFIKVLAFIAGCFPSILAPIAKIFNIGFFRREDMDFYVKNIKIMINERKQNPDEAKKRDILQNLIDAESQSITDAGKLKLTSDELVAQGIMLFLAGYETTSSTLQFLLYELASHKDVMEKIFAEINAVIGDQEPTYELCLNLKYMDATINETLRMYPPLSVLTRQCKKTTKLFDLELPAHTAIAIPVYNLQRDPEFWRNPNNFDPDRFIEGSPTYEHYNPFTYMPFGIGPRLCIGMLLGIMEVKLALIRIFQKVEITKATPEVLSISDFTTILQPLEPIHIFCKPKTCKAKKIN